MPTDVTTSLPNPAEACLFLDFDGTLVDIAETPDGIEVPGDLVALLADLDRALGGRLALVSGRAIGSLAGHLPQFGGVIVGGHGAERRSRDGAVSRLAGSDAEVAEVHAWAGKAEAYFDGTSAELKDTGAALHFRQAPHHEDALRAAAEAYVAAHPDAALQEAHMTIELRPKDANKASAVAALMATAPFKGHAPIFAGDDQTDIPAMEFCRQNGGVAIGLKGIFPDADINLSAPRDLRRLLTDWIR